MVQYSVRSARRSSAFDLSRLAKPHVATTRSTADPIPVEYKRTLLSPPTFCIVWWCVCSFHVFCGSFTLALGGVHALLATPDLYEYASSSLQTPLTMLIGGAVAFLSLGCVHFLIVARMIRRSVHQRQLSFVRLRQRKGRAPLSSHATSWRRLQLSVIIERRRRSSLLFQLTAPSRALHRLWRRYFSIDGLYGLNGEHFDTLFTCREVVEMLSQLYQTYLLSLAVVTPWVNQFAIAVVLVNSVSGLGVRLACDAASTRVSTRHRIALIIDVALDFCSSMLIPVCILYQVVREFDWTTMTIPLALLNSDAWLARRIAEVHVLIITSALDLISMLALHVGVLGAMLTIASDLRREETNHSSRTSVRRIAVVPQIQKSILPNPPSAPANAAPILAAQATPTRSRHLRGRWLLDLLFLASGVSAMMTHYQFQRDSTKAPFCLVHVNAWFVHKIPCAVVCVNCHRFGANDSVVSILDSLDETVLVSVSFVHCVGGPVDVPLALTAFHAIRQLKFINVSAIDWAPGFLLSETHFPRLAYVLFGRTNMTCVPPALLHNTLPTALREIEWSHSNLSALPDTIGRVWATHEWLSIVLDHTQLSALPSSFSSVQCRQLALVDSQIETLPDAFSPSLRKLVVSGNPVEALPSSLHAFGALEQVLAEQTRLTQVPEWLSAWSRGREPDALSLFGSPVCGEDTDASIELGRWCEKDRGSAQGTTRWELLEQFVPV